MKTKTLVVLILLSPMVTATESLAVGSTKEFEIESAVLLVERGSAKPKNRKLFEEAKAKYQEKLKAQEERKIKAIASLNQEKLKESAKQLYSELQSTLELIDDKEFLTL